MDEGGEAHPLCTCLMKQSVRLKQGLRSEGAKIGASVKRRYCNYQVLVNGTGILYFGIGTLTEQRPLWELYGKY